MPAYIHEVESVLGDIDGAVMKLADALHRLDVINLRVTQAERRAPKLGEVLEPVKEETAAVRLNLAVGLVTLQEVATFMKANPPARRKRPGKRAEKIARPKAHEQADAPEPWRSLFGTAVEIGSAAPFGQAERES